MPCFLFLELFGVCRPGTRLCMSVFCTESDGSYRVNP
jgi:hypothetical protein